MAARKKKATPSGDLGESAQRIWLAGVGALASAEEEGGRLFDRLVAKGRDYQKDLTSPFEEATGRLRDTVADVRGRAGRTWKRVETAFDQQVTAALHRLGVPTRREVSELTRRVEALRSSLDGVELRPSTRRVTKTKKKKKNGKKVKTGPAGKKAARKKVKRKAAS